ncbi:MAG: type II toxin-antitoxin system RelE/ParE family toxin [Burkholderiales bacterium]
MSRVEFAPEVADDLDRILEHLEQFELADAPLRVDEILKAFDVLTHNPLIGRIIRADLRELVIGRRARGYVALYKYVAELDTVFALAVRGQKEAGYTNT